MAADLAIHEIAPALIIKYTGETLYNKLYVRILQKLEEESKETNLIILEEEIYIEYLKLVRVFDQKWKPEGQEDILEVFGRIDKLNETILRLPRNNFNQQVAIGIMQSCLNQWKLQLIETQDKLNGIVEIEMIDCINECSLENLLVCTEWIAERYLKCVARS